MGKGRDKRKKVVAKQKAKESAEQRREKQKERERSGLLPPDDDGEDGAEAQGNKGNKKKTAVSGVKELTAMIDEIRRKDKAREEVSVVRCPPPTARLNFTLNMINATEALLFGGEHYDGNPTNTNGEPISAKCLY
jgi:hypothetical protein